MVYIIRKLFKTQNLRFIIESGFKSRAGYNGARTVYIFILDAMIFDPETSTFSSVGATACSHKGSGCTLFYSPKHKNRPTVFIGGSNDTSFDNCAEVLDYTLNNSTWEKRMYSSY